MGQGIANPMAAILSGAMMLQHFGELVMDGLSNLDSVAYVRFASVYRNFREAKDFEEFIDELVSPQRE